MYNDYYEEMDYEYYNDDYYDNNSVAVENYLYIAAMESSNPDKKPGKIRMAIGGACQKLSQRCRKNANSARSKNHEKLANIWNSLAGWFDKMYRWLTKAQDIPLEKIEEVRKNVEEKKNKVYKMEQSMTVMPDSANRSGVDTNYGLKQQSLNQRSSNNRLESKIKRRGNDNTELKKKNVKMLHKPLLDHYKKKFEWAKITGNKEDMKKYALKAQALMGGYASTLYIDPEFEYVYARRCTTILILIM